MATMRGDVAAADRGFAELDQLRGGGADHWGVVLTLLSRPHRARLHGDLAGALAAAEANHALAVSTSSAWFVCSTHLDVAYFRLLNGDAEAARAHASTAATEAAELGSSLLRYGSHLMLAATGAADEQESMADALRLSEERDLRFLLPYSVRLPQLDAALWRALDSESGARAAVLLRSTGAASITALRPVAKGLGDQGSLLAVDVLRSFKAEGRSMLRDLASRPNRALATAANDALAALEAANPHGLSEREAEVLSLLSQGLRTKDVAERLVLTPATVSTHIQRIMNKTGTSSRAELLALAARNAGPAV
jgi:DNA-binding NarL/FixJ family response regulator